MFDIEELISKKKINQRIVELGKVISNKYGNSELYVISVLKGSFVFTSDLVRNISSPVIIDFLIAKCYYDGTSSSGEVKIIKDIDINIENKDVLIVDDITDTGYSLFEVKKMLQKKCPKSISTCTLLDKPARRKVNINPDYYGFRIGNDFIIGYGLDYAEKYRNLPYIGKVKKK